MIIGKEDEEEIWQQVWHGARRPEVECPLIERLEADYYDGPPIVEAEDTFCGENPGKECRFCGVEVGEEHNVIYDGEGSETVYKRLVAPEEE